jgi:hypothetical protein
MTGIYKYGFLSVCGAVFILALYLAAYGAIDRAYAFARYMNGGMSAHDVECALDGHNRYKIDVTP